MFTPYICHLFSGMSKVSLEAESGKTSGEDPRLDIEVEEEADEVAEESLTGDVKQESVDSEVGGGDLHGEMYEIAIDSNDDKRETSDKDMQEVDQDSQREHAVTCDDGEAARMSGSVDNGGLEAERHAERAEAPEESGEADAETKVMFYLILDSQPFQAALHCELLLMSIFIFICFGGGCLCPFVISCKSLFLS